MRIKILDKGTTKELLTYESIIIPMSGDIFPAIDFEDKRQRTVVNRLIMTSPISCDKVIIIYTEFTHPNL